PQSRDQLRRYRLFDAQRNVHALLPSLATATCRKMKRDPGSHFRLHRPSNDVSYRYGAIPQAAAADARGDFQGRKTMTVKGITISRRGFIAAGTAALAAPVFIRNARAQDKFVMKIAHTEGIGTPITNAFDAWAKVMNEKSGGRIDAQHFPAAQLGGLAEALEGSRIGTIQATTAGPDSEEAIAPEIAAFGGAPGFIYKNEAHVDAVLQGELGHKCSDIARAKTGVEFVAYGET